MTTSNIDVKQAAMGRWIHLFCLLLIALATSHPRAHAEALTEEFNDDEILEFRKSGEEAPQQLNFRGFAHCLRLEVPELQLDVIQARHRLSATDLLLLYLSVYPGKRIPGIAPLLQDPAHQRWAMMFEPLERELAEFYLRFATRQTQEPLYPARAFREALRICDQDSFCAALISHNVLRTLGRHEQSIWVPLLGDPKDLNPAWFKQNRELWLSEIPRIQNAIISLRPDGKGDRWGEWYHFFGILTFGVHEMTYRRSMRGVDFVVQLNELLNPLLAGGKETPEKVRLDQDSTQVTWLFLRGHTAFPNLSEACNQRSDYVQIAF